MSNLTESETVAVLALLAVPWAVVALVAVFRGYSLKLWRDRRHDDEAESGQDDVR